MTSFSGRLAARRSGRRKPVFSQWLRAHRSANLVSLAGLTGRSVYDRGGNRVGQVHDLVVALGIGGEHPPLHGILVRTRREVVYIPYTAIAGICRWEVFLTTSGLQPHQISDQNRLVALAGDLLDRQIVDADRIRTVRVSDLVLVCLIGEIRLVGADVSIRTLLRRVGTGWMRRRVATRRVYDWAAVGELVVLRGIGKQTRVLATRHGQQGSAHGEHGRTPGPRLAWRSSAPAEASSRGPDPEEKT